MCRPEAETAQPDPPVQPPTDPDETSGAANQDIEIDIDACELDALELFLDTNDSDLHRFADGCPRRIPPKARRSRERLTWALLERWAWPDCRAYLAEMMDATDIRVALERRGLEALTEVAGIFPPNALVWWAHAAGLDPQEALAALDEDDQKLFALRQPVLQLLAESLQARRDARYAAADEAQARAAQAEAKRLTKQLRWRADHAEEKLRRAAAQVETVARDKEATIRRLEADLEASRQRIAELETENAELRTAFEAAGRAQRETVAALATQVRELAVAARRAGAALPPLLGERVLVVGDDSHKVDYRRTVEELGGSFSFHPGFAAGPRLEAALASATVAVYVAAYASHAAQSHVRAAERAGLAVITVPVAGAEAFRRALLGWCARRNEPSAETAAATRPT